MAEQTIVIHIDGFWRDQCLTSLPENSGIFFVYEANYNYDDETVDILKLLFIGEAENIRNSLMHHESHSAWIEHISNGHELCYACAVVDNNSRKRVNAAYILMHTPPLNNDSYKIFQYDTTTLVSTGKPALINPVVTARKNTTSTSELSFSINGNGMIPVRAAHVRSNKPPTSRLTIGQ